MLWNCKKGLRGAVGAGLCCPPVLWRFSSVGGQATSAELMANWRPTLYAVRFSAAFLRRLMMKGNVFPRLTPWAIVCRPAGLIGSED